MKTLCNICKGEGHEQWYPVPVRVWENIVARKIDGAKMWSPYEEAVSYSTANPNYGIAKNIVYNLQYLEYLAFQIQTLVLSSVLYTQTVKTFIVCMSAIAEAVLKYEVLKQFPDFQSRKFSRLIQKAKNSSLLGEVPQLYEALDDIRDMRNKIHLHLAESSSQTDYNEFDYQKYNTTKAAALLFLTQYFLLTEQEIGAHVKYLKPGEIFQR